MTFHLPELSATRAVSVVRTRELADAAGLVRALVAGGIPVVELTLTIPNLLDHLPVATSVEGAVVGAGTVRTAVDARRAVEAGARFLVTPALVPEATQIIEAGHAAGVPVILGALTPSEVATADALGADIVKIFPARAFGPRYLRDLAGPFPDISLLPSGGVNAENARDFLDAGAVAVSAGTDVVPPDAVAEARWSEITARAAAFQAAIT